MQVLTALLQVDGGRDGGVLSVGRPGKEARLHRERSDSSSMDSILRQDNMQPIQILAGLHRRDRAASIQRLVRI